MNKLAEKLNSHRYCFPEDEKYGFNAYRREDYDPEVISQSEVREIFKNWTEETQSPILSYLDKKLSVEEEAELGDDYDD